MIGEGAYPRQGLIRRSSHRGPGQDKGEGEDEAGGPHLTVSGYRWPASLAVSLPTVITIGCFRTSAPKTENGFIARENCFVGRVGRNNGGKSSINSALTNQLQSSR
jgi:hypothetical protein